MTTTSPTSNVRSREIIGVDQFSQRREVFGKHDTVFLPPASPTKDMSYREVPPIVTSNHGKTTANFKRNAPTYSSMRESRNEDRDFEFRTRKYSDNFTSDSHQRDDVDYRYSMNERNRRLSKLRRDFLNSMNDSNHSNPLGRTGTRASMPANTVKKYKIESPNIYKFPFAEPYATPPPVRRVVVDLGPAEVNGHTEQQDGKENQEPREKPRHQSLPFQESPKIDHQKLFEELLKRYSPERKPVNWELPPTRPRVVGSVPKSTSSFVDSTDSHERKKSEEALNKPEDDDVFIQREIIKRETPQIEIIDEVKLQDDSKEVKQNDPNEICDTITKTRSKSSLNEVEEDRDKLTDLENVMEQSTDVTRRRSSDKYTDLTIPALIDKMSEQGSELESHKNDKKKVKRKRSFLDKLLGRKKEK